VGFRRIWRLGRRRGRTDVDDLFELAGAPGEDLAGDRGVGRQDAAGAEDALETADPG
jgi:hypothetical protein